MSSCWPGTYGPGTRRQDGLMGLAIERTEFKADEESRELLAAKHRDASATRIGACRPAPRSAPPITRSRHSSGLTHTALSSRTYRYRIVPVYGSPKNLLLDGGLSGHGAEMTTEMEFLLHPDFENEGSERHDVYFNRGVIGSQAYARQFGNRTPSD